MPKSGFSDVSISGKQLWYEVNGPVLEKKGSYLVFSAQFTHLAVRHGVEVPPQDDGHARAAPPLSLVGALQLLPQAPRILFIVTRLRQLHVRKCRVPEKAREKGES
eukprot:151352-Prorocentrum_minimum.AAC.1